MKYTMSMKRGNLNLDTETGDISGDTYNCKETIKSDLYATWDAARKVWHSDKLADTLVEYNEYLTRVYHLKVVEAAPATAETTETAQSKETAYDELVNGNDGFYKVVHYTDGSCKKFFIG